MNTTKNFVLEGFCTIAGKRWRISTLIEAAKDCEVFDMPLKFIDKEWNIWGIETFQEIIDHCIRTRDVDPSYPIIMSPSGTVMDGYHRILKAYLEGRETVKAVMLDKLPAADSDL